MIDKLRLGLNIDHVATIRNARGGFHPEPMRAAKMAAVAGVDLLTIHLREDRRHILDQDVAELTAARILPINLEMAATNEMQAIALKHRPHAVCLVPERRQEVTTEGGLNAAGQVSLLKEFVTPIKDLGARVSLFIDPEISQVEAAVKIGATAIEFHTGPYCHARPGDKRQAEWTRIANAVAVAKDLGLECHAGHGLSYENVAPIAAIADIVELNIGHFLIGEAIFRGLENAIREMRRIMDDARRTSLQ